MRRRKTTQADRSGALDSESQMALADPQPGTAVPSIGDLDAYLAHLAHLDMPLAMKIELITALRTIMQSFVDRAFGDDPVQQVGRLHGGPEGKSDAKDAGAVPPVVDLAPTTPTETDDNDLTGALRDHAEHDGSRK